MRKIGGAKKDLWKDHGLYTDDPDGMNEREAEKYVKKDNIRKKPDYQAISEIDLLCISANAKQSLLDCVSWTRSNRL